MRPQFKALRGSGPVSLCSFHPPYRCSLLATVALSLAGFALVLQITQTSSPSDASYGLMDERELIRHSKVLPRLENELRKQAKDAFGEGISLKVDSLHQRKMPIAEELGFVDWNWENNDDDRPLVAFTVTTSEHVEQIRLWLAYHRAIGVSVFYLFVEGRANSSESQEILRKEPGVTVIPDDAHLREKHAQSHIWQEHWLSAFFNKPCNHELFVRQSLNMADAIELARKDGVDWILHIDTDELVYPGGSSSYSLREVLHTVPSDVDLLIFPNYESLAESVSVSDPFAEVSLFKRSYSHVSSNVYFKEYARVSRGNPNYFTTYGNGKSAARIQPGLRPNGAHRWHNYNKKPVEWSSEQSAVLHYTYNRFSDLKSRRDRCDCKPTPQDAEQCFILPFDRLAFLESSLKDDASLMQFFKSRLVWDDPNEVSTLVHEGLFVRLYAPQILIRGLKSAIKKDRDIHSIERQRAEASFLSTQKSSARENSTKT